jgi:hypothetical protein
VSLDDDVKLAWLLLDRPLSPHTKPTEKEARAALRRVLEAVGKSLPGSRWADVSFFLWAGLADALDPREDVAVLRKAHFTDMGTGTRKALTAATKDMQIAAEVYLLNKAGQHGVSLVAKRTDKDPSQISRAYKAYRQQVELRFASVTASQAAEELKNLP